MTTRTFQLHYEINNRSACTCQKGCCTEESRSGSWNIKLCDRYENSDSALRIITWLLVNNEFWWWDNWPIIRGSGSPTVRGNVTEALTLTLSQSQTMTIIIRLSVGFSDSRIFALNRWWSAKLLPWLWFRRRIIRDVIRARSADDSLFHCRHFTHKLCNRIKI